MFLIGISLIAIDTFIFSFILAFIGSGFIITSIISLIYTFNNPIVQMSIVYLFGFSVYLIFRLKILPSLFH